MKFFSFLLLVATAFADTNGVTRPLPCTISNLYLDVAVAIDYSNNMGTTGILQAVNDVISVFSPVTVAQTLSQVSRVAVVNYTNNANTLATLDHFTSTSQLSSEIFNYVPKQTVDSDGFVGTGLSAASMALSNGRSSGTRNNVPQAIIIYVAQYSAVVEPSAVTQANTIKASGISIVFVANSPTQNVNALTSISSPGMAFLASDPQLVQKVQTALCTANAHCQTGWTQVSNNFASGNQLFGECIRVVDHYVNRTEASSRCNTQSSYLVSEFDDSKETFVNDYLSHFYNRPTPPSYWIGLMRSSGKYQWDQMPGQNPIPILPGGYSKWFPGQPNCLDPCPFIYTENIGSLAGWSSVSNGFLPYVCQQNTCDTDNYCS